MSRPPGCAGQAAGALSAYTQVKMEDASALNKIVQNSHYGQSGGTESSEKGPVSSRKTDRFHDSRLLSSNWRS